MWDFFNRTRGPGLISLIVRTPHDIGPEDQDLGVNISKGAATLLWQDQWNRADLISFIVRTSLMRDQRTRSLVSIFIKEQPLFHGRTKGPVLISLIVRTPLMKDQRTRTWVSLFLMGQSLFHGRTRGPGVL